MYKNVPVQPRPFVKVIQSLVGEHAVRGGEPAVSPREVIVVVSRVEFEVNAVEVTVVVAQLDGVGGAAAAVTQAAVDDL